MLLHILDVIAPVFLIIGAGYLSVKRNWFAANLVDGLMKFSILFAVPCLLFRATSQLDLKAAYDWRMMTAFYLAAAASFVLASVVVKTVFRRHAGESVAIGFGALFSNSVLIGLPISERAWGVDNMGPAFAIISLHAPFCYLLGISTMEVLRSDGRSYSQTIRVVMRAMFRNSLMIGIGLGFIVNLSGMQLPGVISASVDILSQAALPVALFGIGGVLTRYRLSQSISEVGTVTAFSLLFHPAAAYLLCLVMGVAHETTRVAVLIAAMAPGINSYLFASMYQRGQSIAAGAVVLGTSASIFTISLWLWVLQSGG
jgi:malonate transporter